jgi:glycosyltransferase involved in cell wall biosynthesis
MNDFMVSVVINCFNGERYLKEAIESVRAQSYRNWEIVFWDNASTDGSAAIARAVGPQLRYFRSVETVPLGAARNKALAEAKGVYVTFLDCDDILLPHALETEVKALEEHRCALVYGGSIVIDSGGNEIRRRIPKARYGNLLSEQLRQYEIGLPAVMIRRQVLAEGGLGFDPALQTAEDYCLFMQVAAAYDICTLPELLAKYRIHHNALTLKTIAAWGSEVDYTLDLLCARYPDLKERHKTALRIARARAAYYRARSHVLQRDRRRAVQALSRHLFTDYRYFLLFTLLFLPFQVWNTIHKLHDGRSFRG